MRVFVLRDSDLHVLAGGNPEAVERSCRQTALVDGGQDRQAHEVWQDGDRLCLVLALPAILLVCATVGIGMAQILADAATKFGAAFLSH